MGMNDYTRFKKTNTKTCASEGSLIERMSEMKVDDDIEDISVFCHDNIT